MTLQCVCVCAFMSECEYNVMTSVCWIRFESQRGLFLFVWNIWSTPHAHTRIHARTHTHNTIPLKTDLNSETCITFCRSSYLLNWFNWMTSIFSWIRFEDFLKTPDLEIWDPPINTECVWGERLVLALCSGKYISSYYEHIIQPTVQYIQGRL